MTTGLFTHPACLAHDTGEGHPERPQRLEAVLAALDAPAFAALDRHEAPLATRAELERVHPAAYLASLDAAMPDEGLSALDADTVISPFSADAALRAAGAGIAAVDAVLAGRLANVFCAVRPPGHHAEAARAMGFCLLSSAAIAARHAIQAHGLNRVAILDFDVHHGNGTQAIVWDDPAIFFGSSHQFPFYPGSGAASERGAHGQIVNVPLRAGDGSEAFRAAWEHTILPAADSFAPQLIVISAGFDAHRADPLAQIELDTADFDWVTGEIGRTAQRCGCGIVSLLEGGYDLKALAASTAAHVARLMAL